MKIFCHLLAKASFFPYCFVRKFFQSKQKDMRAQKPRNPSHRRKHLPYRKCASTHSTATTAATKPLYAKRGCGTTSSRSHVLHGLKKVNIAGNVPITAS